jgi:hypothetical protein
LSEKLAFTAINARYRSWDQYDNDVDEDGVLEDAKARADELQAQVRPSPSANIY